MEPLILFDLEPGGEYFLGYLPPAGPALQIVVAQIASARPRRRAQAFLVQCLESFAPVTPG